MPEVQNVGAIDSVQYQPSQYSNEEYTEDYNTQPEVYDEQMAEIRAANKSRLGASLLSAAIIGGLAYWGGRTMGKKAASKELEKAKDAVANYEKVLEEVKNKAEKIDIAADGIKSSKFDLYSNAEKFVENVQAVAKSVLKKIKGLKEVTQEAADNASK